MIMAANTYSSEVNILLHTILSMYHNYLLYMQVIVAILYLLQTQLNFVSVYTYSHTYESINLPKKKKGMPKCYKTLLYRKVIYRLQKALQLQI